MAWLRQIVREPLLHFAVLGALAFLLARGFTESDDALVVTRAQQQQLFAAFERERGRPPSDEERTAIIDRWVDSELLYREAIALGLDRDDPVIRRRVLAKIDFVGNNIDVPEEPDDDTLRAFMSEHASRYAGAPRLDLETVGVRDEAEAHAILDRLHRGEDPKTIGGTFSSGRRFNAGHLARTYGPAVAVAAVGLPPNMWAIVALDSGFVLLRVTATHEGDALPFENIRNRLLVDWHTEQRRIALEQRVEELRERTRVVVEP